MKSWDSRPTLEALASEHGMLILRFLRDRHWTLASQIAKGLGIHTSTAGKYLAAFHAAGFLERRAHRAKRPTYVYRLRSPIIRIEFDLVDGPSPRDVVSVARSFLDTLFHAARRVGGDGLAAGLVRDLFGEDDWRPALERRLLLSGNPRAALNSLVRDVRRACANRVGVAATGRLVRVAASASIEGRREVVEALGLIDAAR